jgi:hypothetical protein
MEKITVEDLDGETAEDTLRIQEVSSKPPWSGNTLCHRSCTAKL